MILKNEEANVHRLLGKIGKLFDEIVVCDTGSTDDTVMACMTHGARVVQRPWRDFATARNYSLALARGRFCMWLDGDDDVSHEDMYKIRASLDAAAANMGFFVNLFCESPHPERQMTCQQLRIFPNLPGLRWDRKIHEQIVNSCAERGVRFAALPVTVRHLGYDTVSDRAKYERNYALLMEEIREHPNDIVTMFHIAQTLIGLSREHEALDVLKQLSKVRSARDFENSLATRSAAIAANMLTQSANKVALSMLEEALALTPHEDMIRVSLAERYSMAGKGEKVRETLKPIAEREGLNMSLMPYPMQVVGDVAVRLWHQHA